MSAPHTTPGYTGGRTPAPRWGRDAGSRRCSPRPRLYVEPFAGMLGVLLQRAPAEREIVNDLDERVVNWWRVVRNSPAELQRLIALTPKARREHEWALRAVDDADESPPQRALAFTLLAQCALARPGWYAPRFVGRQVDWRAGMDTGLVALAERIRNVELECRDACDLLERTAGIGDALLYVESPYAETVGDGGAYRYGVDRARLLDVLRAQRGKVAVSGYDAEWDGLGWARTTRSVRTNVGNTGTNDVGGVRVEVLWTNFAPAQQALPLEAPA